MKRGSVTSSDPGSLKWISVGQNRNRTELTVNQDVSRLVFRPTGKKPCNLISVFGAARQGKSFLMNCLAGETELFQISNQRESCTQGIDISQHLIPLSAFSAIHGGRSTGGATNIGFVDAEGQGDRDVTYDANLICPVLLASKCVIFNWKDSMQKDKILNQLGILHKAAINVALEDDSFTDESDVKLFGHLHLVFRDWQYEGSDEKSVYNDIFKEERSSETAAAVRNQIRRSVKENFASISVWLFPAPVKDSAQLSTRLTYDITQASFKEQLGALRSKLSSQLSTPSMFDGQALCGNTIGGIVETIATVLNTGDAVRPNSAWVSMMCSEIEQTRILFEKTVRKECDKVLESFGRRCVCTMTSSSSASASRRLSMGDVKREGKNKSSISSGRSSLNIPPRADISDGLVSSLFPRWDQAEQTFRSTVSPILDDYLADVNAITGSSSADSSGRPAHPSTLSPEDSEKIDAAIMKSIESEHAHFSSQYVQLCSQWVRAAKETCLDILDSECKELQLNTPYIDSELNEAMEVFFNELSQLLRDRRDGTLKYIATPAKATSKHATPAETFLNEMKLDGAEAEKRDVEDTLRNIRQAADLQYQVVRHANDDSKRKAEAACRDCLSDSQRKLEDVVDDVAQNLVSSSCGVSKVELMSQLDQQFKQINDSLWETVTSMPLGHKFIEGFQKDLEKTGIALVKKVELSYSEACHKFVKKILNEAIKTISTQTEYLLETNDPVDEDHLISIFQELVNKVGEAASNALAHWTFAGSDRIDWFEEPLRSMIEQRLHSIQVMNRKMLAMAAKEASLREQQEEMQRLHAKKASCKRPMEEVSSDSEEIEAPTPPKSRRGTKRFKSEEEEAEFDMQVDGTTSDPIVKGKGRRLTKKFENEREESQYDMDISNPEEEISLAAPGRLPSGRVSHEDQRRRAAEWAAEQKKAKSTSSKASVKAKTPPIPNSESEDEAPVAPKGKPKEKGASKAVVSQKMSKAEMIQQAKENARLAIEQRKNGKLANLAIEIQEEEMRGGRPSDNKKRRKSNNGN